jgi:hypothetical protein
LVKVSTVSGRLRFSANSFAFAFAFAWTRILPIPTPGLRFFDLRFEEVGSRFFSSHWLEID